MRHVSAIIILVLAAGAGVVRADIDGIDSSAALFLHERTPSSDVPVKSGTPELIEMLQGDTVSKAAFAERFNALGRPSMERYADSAEGHFRVHYNTTGLNAPPTGDTNINGIPDYVDSTLVYLEHAWDLLMGLGYGAPKSDGVRGGSGAVDCYINDLSSQRLYGFCTPDDNTFMGMASSYITIDNNYADTIYYSRGYDGLRVSTAHEFFHVIHYSYYGGRDGVWWMEQTATWFEDRAWDDVNDYVNYFPYYLDDHDKPLDTKNGIYEYGAAVFPMFIAEKKGTEYLRRTWSAFKDYQSGKIELFDAILSGGLGETIGDFATAMYFTGSRANTDDFLSESNLLDRTAGPDLSFASFPAADTLSFRQYSYRFVDIAPSEGFTRGDTLKVSFNDMDDGSWERRVIMYNDPHDVSLATISWRTPVVIADRSYEKAILVITNTSSLDTTYRYAVGVEIASRQHVEEPAPAPFSLAPNYPNPFNAVTTIPVTVPSAGQLVLTIHNLAGQTVDTLTLQAFSAGTVEFPYDASRLASGVYIVRARFGGLTDTGRMTLVK